MPSSGDQADVVAELGERLRAAVCAKVLREGLTPAILHQVGQVIFELQSEIGRDASAAATRSPLALIGYSGGTLALIEEEQAEELEEEEMDDEDFDASAGAHHPPSPPSTASSPDLNRLWP